LPDVHPLHLDHLIGVPIKVQGEEGLDPWVDHRPRFWFWLWLGFGLWLWLWLGFGLWFWLWLGFGLRLWLWLGFGFRLRLRFRLGLWFWLWLSTLHEGQAKRGVVFDIGLLRRAQAQSLHGVRPVWGSGHLHSIGPQRGEHREVAAPWLAGLFLDGYASTATRPRDLDLLAHEAPAFTVYDVKEDMMLASRLLNVIPQDLS
jgi:hypothetical protein